MVNRSVDHNHSHPSHQDHFKILRIPVLKLAKVAEHFYKSIIYHVYCFIVTVDVTEYGLQAIAIVFLIEKFLIPLAVLNTAGNNVLQKFQSG